jgi:hypothetical protein
MPGAVLMLQNYEGNDDRTSCVQQLAVVMTNNEWLTDPVGGQHNFNFGFYQ